MNDIVVIAIDSTGIKVSNRGEWMRHKWHVRRERLLEDTHVTVVDIRKKIVALHVTSEQVHDDGQLLLNKLVQSESKK